MSCDRFEWLLPALADADEAAHSHLAECGVCRAQWTEISALLGEVAVGLPLGRSPDLRASVAARVASLPPARLRRASWLPYAAAAALVLGAASLPLQWRGAGSGVAAADRSAPVALSTTAATYDFEDALFAGAADTELDGTTLEARIFTGAE